MKKIILFAAIIIFTSCGDSSNSFKCYQCVQNKYPNSTIVQVPDKEYKFIVRNDSCGSIRIVGCYSSISPSITSDELVIPCIDSLPPKTN